MQVVRDGYQWLASNPAIGAVVLGLSAVTLIVGLLLVPIVLTRLPADYLLRAHAPLERFLPKHPALRVVVLVAKNVIGALLVCFGILMLVLPGQGLLTMLIGLSLLNFPGKRRLILWLIARGPVIQAINWVRDRASRPPLELPPPHGH
jgi:hypothetical protein